MTRKRLGLAGRLGSALALALLALPTVGAPTASASTDPIYESQDVLARVTSADGSHITRVKFFQDPTFAHGRGIALYVFSVAMNKEIPLEVQRPDDVSKPRPVLYLLNGGGGGEDGAIWQNQTNVMPWLADKKVNVVTPIGGKYSYYTDWRAPDPVLGVNKWRTFLTEELPPIIDAALGTNGKNSIAGLSMSGTSVLQLPEQAPGLYQSAAAYSGCAQTSDPLGQAAVKYLVELRGGGSTVNMWGPPDDPLWVENDPVVHAEKLRGVSLYISSGNGLPGKYDIGPQADPGPDGIVAQITVGGGIEAVTRYCSLNLQHRLEQLGIPATYNFPPSGTHSWKYWQDDLKDSWPVISAPLGID